MIYIYYLSKLFFYLSFWYGLSKLQSIEIKQIIREIDGNISKEEFRKKYEFSTQDKITFLY